jgi:single-stranded-DNA-specific exonuclease
MSKLWQLKPPAPQSFHDEFPELDPLTVQLLYNRGLTEPGAVEKFLSPQYDELHNPFLFQDMQKAVEQIWQAIHNKEKILVYSDYDADAVTANAVLQQTFRYLGVEAESYIPDRFTEGYGLNLDAFFKIKEQGAGVVITVDCGTNSVAEAEYCKQNGIDLIITDHHEITGATPEAFALINPKNPADHYPDDQITGVGVAYKLAKAILSHKDNVLAQKGIPENQYVDWDKWLLDLVAIGTVADCHSLLGENRILVSLGLKVLAKTRWLGLKELLNTAGVDPRALSFDTYILGFILAPRINAAGRLEHADVALDLLLAKDLPTAATLARELETINKRRQDLTARVVSEAREQVELIAERKVLLLTNPGWPRGLVGLVAGKLADEYNRPVIVLEQGEIESTGSARSGGGFNMIEALKAAQHLLVRFGGHKQAAGLTVRTEHVETLYEKILEFAEQHAYENVDDKILELEAELSEPQLNLQTHELIAQFEPFGVNNPKPKFLIRGAKVITKRAVGAEQKHLQMQLLIGNMTIDTIGFNLAYLAAKLDGYTMIDIAAETLADTWNGTTKFKLRIIDIRQHE